MQAQVTNRENDVEEWRDVVGFESRYEVSSFGNLRSKSYLKHAANMGGPISFWTVARPIKYCVSDGYAQVVLSENKVRKTTRIHILVAQAFLPNPLDLPQVNHGDSNRLNNRLWNLEWVTAKYNVQHSYDSGFNSNEGELHPRAVLTDDLVREIRAMYGAGTRVVNISKTLGLNRSTVSKVVNNKNWSHVV